MTGESESDSERAVAVAVGVAVACLVYAASLVAQRPFPALRSLLAWELAPDVRPTYYLRVGASLALGLAAGTCAGALGRRGVSERACAWGTALAVGFAAVLVALFP